MQQFRDLLIMCMNLNDIYVSNIKAFDYRCIIRRLSKSESINLIQNIDLTEKKVEHYKKINIKNNF